MLDSEIATRLRFTAINLPLIAIWQRKTEDKDENIFLCHRHDYHKDGSASDYYYLEISHKQFIEMGGTELRKNIK